MNLYKPEYEAVLKRLLKVGFARNADNTVVTWDWVPDWTVKDMDEELNDALIDIMGEMHNV